MPTQLKTRFNDIIGKWNALERQQKVKIGIAVGILVLSLIGFIYISIRPNMVTVYNNLTLTQVGEIQKVLSDNNIKHTYTQDSFAVDAKDVDNVKILLAESNIPSDSEGFNYQDAINSNGMGTTSAMSKSNLNKAEETKLSSTIEQFAGVTEATVIIKPKETTGYFIDTSPPASAAVKITTNREIKPESAQGIARFVAASVIGLELENIEIIDHNMNLLYSGSIDVTSGSYNSEYDQELRRKNELEAKIKSALSPLYNSVMVTPNLYLSWDKVQESSKILGNPDDNGGATGFIDRSIEESSSFENTGVGDEPGVSSNDGTAPQYNTQGNGNSSAETGKRQDEYLYNETEVLKESSVGQVDSEKSSISVIVYNYRTYDESILTENGTLDNISWQDYKDTIEEKPLVIEDIIYDTVRTATGINANNISIAGFELPVFIDKELEPVPYSTIFMFLVLALLIIVLAVGLIRNSQKSEITEIEPELSVEDLLVSTQIEEEKEIERLKEIEFNAENETKKQIDKFVVEKPEAVAQLLRSWLSDDWE